MIKERIDKTERFKKLKKIADYQLSVLNEKDFMKTLNNPIAKCLDFASYVSARNHEVDRTSLTLLSFFQKTEIENAFSKRM